jgi:5-formyltetrahydrofolate cyclo-ligase
VTTKTALRARMRALRRQLAEACPDAAERVAVHAPALPGVEVFGLYHPVGSELDPTAIRLPGARRALPVVVERQAALVFRLHEPGEALAPDALGVPAPTTAAPEVWPDVVFTPVLAFDRAGGRLGQGGGHFDRTIEALRGRKRVVVIGVAYAGQEVAEVPLEPHDQRLDGILTETGYITVR